MIYLELFLGFLRVGCFSFGGAYSAVPLIRDITAAYGWLDDETLAYMIAVSESTPGSLMVNLATYVGSSQGGFWGAAIATLAVVLPAFGIILLVTAALNAALDNRYVQAMFSGLIPCIIGIILATGLSMTGAGCLVPAGAVLDGRAVGIAAVLLAAAAASRVLRKKRISPIVLILLSACAGILVYGA